MNNVIKYLGFSVAVVLAFSTTSISQAYEFEFLGMGSPIHDKLTETALRCIIENESESFTNCENFQPLTPKKRLAVNVFGMKQLSVDDLVYAVRWPDDPVRELRGYKLLKMPVWGTHMRYAKCEGKRDGLKDGLRCSSHYGPAQFLHAMEGENQKSPYDTRDAILDWTQFAYQIALNKQANGKHFSELDYCDFFSKLPADKYFKEVMYPDNGNAFPCNEYDDTPWTVSTPFAFSCSIGTYNCTEWNSPNDIRVRNAALGAVLHVIQDSYAKGHTLRGSESNKTITNYNCSEIKQFQVYGKQDTDKHKMADSDASPSSNCLSPSLSANNIHGPITASAHVIRLFKEKADPKSLRKYLASHVFVLAKDATPADSTDYFLRD